MIIVALAAGAMIGFVLGVAFVGMFRNYERWEDGE